LTPTSGHSDAQDCCHVGTAVTHSVPDRVKPLFVIFDLRALWRSVLNVRVPGCQNYKWLLGPVWHRMRYSCTHMATVLSVIRLNYSILMRFLVLPGRLSREFVVQWARRGVAASKTHRTNASTCSATSHVTSSSYHVTRWSRTGRCRSSLDELERAFPADRSAQLTTMFKRKRQNFM